MKKLFSKFIGAMLLSFICIFAFSTLVSAHPFPRPHNQSGCAHLLVHLQGSKSAITTCLDATTSSSSVTPFTSTVGCMNNTLELDTFTALATESICFIGTGYANMSDYIGPWYATFNWNDAALNYKTGCNSGTFYSDSNGNGIQQPFSPHEEHDFDGQSGRLPALTLSSLRITSSC
jgi:hypothetical protein